MRDDFMSKSKIFLFTGFSLSIIMIVYIFYALQHPELTFIGGNKVAYVFYGLYLLLVASMFILSLKKRNK